MKAPLKFTWLFCSMLVSSLVYADFDKGFDAYMAGNYQEAATQFEDSANQGDVYSQVALGTMYLENRGLKVDQQRALNWFQKAADQGYPRAQLYVGLMYLEGEGVQQDFFTAINWLKKSALQGNPDAQYKLGLLIENGKGARKDSHEAKKWYGLSCGNQNQKGCDSYARLVKKK
ncbi:tetratricopeptide repeat protein [Thiomicrorhabdus sp. 6S3-12]|uniref:tetratricopeptide repeat protein n=1 Tax=Thiomicrorhabdus sp. 6S3-12 TaxID=2819681 RepID=UPI001AAC58F6|nr:tetratricopeptide repeat protein [Thiomicrorhabdus sp. 6S3-12]MBO1923164.1 sel1 repeat family protein [Thiomicrorhabdus sp. 6S3-12]